MPPSSLKVLRDAIKGGSFDPAYYIVGEDEFQKEDAITQLIDAALDPAVADFNLDIRRASDLSGESLGVLLGTPPMMAERRVVVLRDVAGLKKDAQRVLEQYLKVPAEKGCTKSPRAVSEGAGSRSSTHHARPFREQGRFGAELPKHYASLRFPHR